MDALDRYIQRSGHLNTVSGRRPRAYRRLTESLALIRQELEGSDRWQELEGDGH